MLKAGASFNMYEGLLYRAKKYIKEVSENIHPDYVTIPVELVLLEGKGCPESKAMIEFARDRNICIHEID